MTWFNGVQLMLAAACAALIIVRLRQLAYGASLDGATFVAALGPALQHGQTDLASRIAHALLPAWPAQLAAVALDAMAAGAPDDAVRAQVDELRFELEQASADQLPAILTLGRMAGPLAFIGIIVELGRGLSGDGGLLALQRGAAESASLERALLTFAIGLGTTSTCLFAVALLRTRARQLRDDLARVARSVDRALARDADM